MIDGKITEPYKTGNYAYPEFMGDPRKMDKDWYLKFNQALFCDYSNNRTAIPYEFGDNLRSYAELREYARGTNSPDKYKPLLIGKDEKGKNRNSWMNISMAVPQIMPKFRDVIKGIAMSIDFDVTMFATDPSSQAQREKEKAYYKLQMSPTFNKLKQSAKKLGINVKDTPLNFDKESQVDLFFEAGGFKLGVEIAAMACIIQSRSLSDIDTIKEQVIEDLIDIGIGVMSDELTAGGQVKCRYVDPAKFFCAYSEYNDHRNINKCAEMRYYRVRELREETELSEEEIMHIARKYAKNYGNDLILPITDRFFTDSDYRDRTFRRPGALPIDDYRVPVLRVCFIASEIDAYTKVKNKNTGRTVINTVDADYKLSERSRKDGKVLVRNKVEYSYESKWIPGTSVVFDYGKSKYQLRPNQLGTNEVRLPYHVYKTGSASVIERCVPYVDDIALATYKIRNAIAALPPAPRIAIDKSILENMTLGGVKFTPLEAIDLLTQRGILYFQSLDDHGDQRTGSTTNPITPLPISISEDIGVFRSEIEQGIVMIRQVTGINELVDGSTPPERTAVGVANLASGATNNTLKPLFKGYESIYKRACENMLLRWQLLVTENGYKGKAIAIGESNVKTIELTKDFALADIGLFVKAASTAQEREQMLAQITEMRNMNIGNGGKGGISPDVFIMLRQTILSGNMPQAQKLLAEAIEQQRQKDEELEMKRIQANAQVQQQSAIVSEEEKRKTELLKHLNKMKELGLEGYIKAELITQEADITNALNNLNKLFAPPTQQTEPNQMQ